jgi:hypothetical protein
MTEIDPGINDVLIKCGKNGDGVNPEAHNRPLVRYLPSLACLRA